MKKLLVAIVLALVGTSCTGVQGVHTPWMTWPKEKQEPQEARHVVTVPEEAPTACLDLIYNGGPYKYERECLRVHAKQAWLTHEEAVSLIQQIWSDVEPDSEAPSTPPDLFTGSKEYTLAVCRNRSAGGCSSSRLGGIVATMYERSPDQYKAPRHMIIHEMAHHMTTSDHLCAEAMGRVERLDNSEDEASRGVTNQCSHNANDKFRCLVEYLYVRYAEGKEVGVCGTTDLADFHPNIQRFDLYVTAPSFGGRRTEMAVDATYVPFTIEASGHGLPFLRGDGSWRIVKNPITGEVRELQLSSGGCPESFSVSFVGEDDEIVWISTATRDVPAEVVDECLAAEDA